MSKRSPMKIAVNEEDRLTLDGRPSRHFDTFKDGIVLESDDGGPRTVFALTWTDVEDHLRTCRLVIDKGYYAPSSKTKFGKTISMEHVARFEKFGPSPAGGPLPNQASTDSLKVGPMDILEMDDHKVDIRRVGLNLGFWNRLHPEVQACFEKARSAWAMVAMDACTRSFCALRLTMNAPDASDAIATLAMAVREKGAENVLHNGRTNWPQCGRPGGVHIDCTEHYTASEFAEKVGRLTGKPPIPSSQHPHLRGRVERAFRAMCTGRVLHAPVVGDSILLAENFDPTKHSHLTPQELLDLLALLIVACYHNNPHRALGWETPLERWEQLSQQGEGVAPPPSKDEYRALFGIKLRRRVRATGISIAGIEYRSARLAGLREAHHRVEVDVLLNDCDLSVISFRDPRDGGWHNAPSVYSGLGTVTLSDWMEAVRYIKESHGRSSDADRRAVAAALNEFKRAGANL